MTKSKQVLATALAGTTLLFASGASHGLGFGKPVSRAILGDTLWITVPLRLEAGEEISDECLAAEVFFGDDKLTASAVSTALTTGPGNEYMLRVSTSAPVNEPVVTVYLAAGCKVRITRKFIAFADPPVVNPATTSLAKATDVAEVINTASLPPGDLPPTNTIGAPRELAAAVQPTARGDKRTSVSRASGKRGKGRALAGAPVMTIASVATNVSQFDKPGKRSKASGGKPGATGRHQSTTVARAAAKAPAKAFAQAPLDTGRLVLDPVEADAMFTPALRMSSALGAVASADDQSANVRARREAAAAVWLALNATPEQMALDRQRLQALEQRLAQLKQEGEQARADGLALQTQVRHAQENGAARKTSYLLGLLALAGVGAAVYLWRQLREEKKRTQAWWQSENQALNEAPAQAASLPVTGETPERDTSPGVADVVVPVVAPPVVSPEPAEVAPMPPRRDAVMAEPGSSTGAHHVSVEELIDLEQQAEFFAVLGQDDAAIGLLEGHVQHANGGSPLPFLKLLDAYQNVGQRADFDRVGAEFRQRFEALPPEWGTDLQQGRTLAEYPDIVAALQTAWVTPRDAMTLLDKTLTRPEPGSVIFDLPTYRELLFLYAVARDLSERDVHDRRSVDLLLPVTDTSGKAPATKTKQAARADSLMSTRPNKAMPQAAPTIEIDLPLDDLQVPADTHKA